jgi:hypothetical protein
MINRGQKARKKPAVPSQCCTLDIRGSQQDDLVAMFKALGNPVRFGIMKFLLTHPGCITGDIVDEVGLAQSTVSQHLKVLRDAGWIQGAIDGPATNYCLNPARISWFRDRVEEVF